MRAIVCLPFLLSVAACSAEVTPPAAPPGAVLDVNATMVKAVDGDTIDVVVYTPDGTRHERVRLIGIDTPETKKPNTPVQCWGPEASANTATMLPPDTPLHLERDVEARDPYDRLLAYVYLTDGRFVNLDIVSAGFARPLRIEPNTAHAGEFAAAARDAEAADRGLWGACSG